MNGTEFSQEVQIGNKHIKKYSTCLVIIRMQIKMTLRFHLTYKNGNLQENK
jgi:hypothetical protein